MGKITFFFAVWMVLGRPAPVEVDIARIVGKSSAEIERYLGKSSGTDVITPYGQRCGCERQLYFDKLVGIVYLDGVADWIWIDPGVVIQNLRTTHYWAYHKFPEYQLIRAKQRDGNSCCLGS